MLVMNERAMSHLIADKFTLGAKWLLQPAQSVGTPVQVPMY